MMNKDEIFISIILKCDINLILIKKSKAQQILFMNMSSLWLKKIINTLLCSNYDFREELHPISKMATILNQIVVLMPYSLIRKGFDILMKLLYFYLIDISITFVCQ